jgi:hypothetical protein
MKKIIKGFQNCWANFQQWKYLISYNYNDYEHWVFFSYINGTENIGPYVITLSAEDYDSLIKMLNEPPDPEAIARLSEIMSTPAPWDN